MIAFALSVLAAPQAAVWYGPATVSFTFPLEGSPYDPAMNDLRVRFERPKQTTEERLAYFDGGTIKCVLVSPIKGPYRATLLMNRKPAPVAPQSGELSKPLPNGFLRVAAKTRRFQYDSGGAYWPIGHNLGWQTPNLPDITEQIAQMAKEGINWTRIWACQWDGKNPFWPQDGHKLPVGTLDPKVLSRWDQIVVACAKNGVRFQFVLFHHGQFASTVNPNWPDHPWNAKNGGFLANAADFFTNPTAKRLAKLWLRYAVARWGHSPSIMAWELFNEVEWVDARYQNRWADIEAWHAEMADYLRTIDPYRHLITSSSAMEQPALWAKLDYYQPHTYPPDISSAVAGATLPKDKPLFYGEFGPGDFQGDAERRAIRDGIWAAALSCHAGAAQYWYWDRMQAAGMYAEYRTAANVLKAFGFAGREGLRPLALKVDAPMGGDLVFGPGVGWGATSKFDFQLPEEATAANLGKLSGFMNSHTGGNKALFPEPLTFRFKAPVAGALKIRLGTLAKAGASLRVSANGAVVTERKWDGGNADRPLNETLEAKFPAGDVVLKIESLGPDWVVVQSFSISGIAPLASGMACGDKNGVLVRLRASGGARLPIEVGLSGLGLPDGRYDAEEWDLGQGTHQPGAVQIQADRVVGKIKLTSPDSVFVLTRRP